MNLHDHMNEAATTAWQYREVDTCPTCHGASTRWVSRHNPMTGLIEDEEDACLTCDGTGVLA